MSDKKDTKKERKIEKGKTKKIEANGDTSDDEDDDELVCCCLCYNAVDYSDKSYFCQEARDADSDLEGEQPMLLPPSLHDANNALVYCDSCDRPYHQRCHFVPVIHLPRGDWHCFICSTSQKLVTDDKKFTKPQLESLYPMQKQQSASGPLEKKWEHATRHLKVTAFKTEMRRLKSGLSQQLQSIRMAQMALNAFTTSRRKTSTSAMLKSQELCQTLVKLTLAKLRVRQLLCSLEAYRRGDEEEWNTLQEFLKQNPKERKSWFPFEQEGNATERRLVPRLREDEEEQNDDDAQDVPTEIQIGNGKQQQQQHSCAKNAKTTTTSKKKNHDDDDDDNDSGISLDDLKCCVCLVGEATDENDLLLCDGQGCFRAHHYHCLSPAMTAEKAEAEEDWFCPLCTTIAKLVADVQSEYTGDEWVTEDAESIQSWDNVKDVFPEAELEYTMAMKWKTKNLDQEATEYLKALFGDDSHGYHQYEENDDDDDVVMEDDNDDEEDDDFDPTAKKEDDVGSDTSSRASKLDMSDVELNIGRKELSMLSGGEEESESDDDDDSENENDANKRRRRKSRRMRSARSSRTNTDNDEEESSSGNEPLDVGQFSERNIVQGKRKRRKIDYRRLNDSMFGKLSAKDKKAIDDADDFQYKAPKRRRKDTSSDSSNHEDDDSDDDSSDDENDNDDDDENEGITSKDNSETSEEPKPAAAAKNKGVLATTRKKSVGSATKRKPVPLAKKDQRRLVAKKRQSE